MYFEETSKTSQNELFITGIFEDGWENILQDIQATDYVSFDWCNYRQCQYVPTPLQYGVVMNKVIQYRDAEDFFKSR